MILGTGWLIEVDSKGAFSKVNTSDETRWDLVVLSDLVYKDEYLWMFTSWRAWYSVADFCSEDIDFAACVLLYPCYYVDQ